MIISDLPSPNAYPVSGALSMPQVGWVSIRTAWSQLQPDQPEEFTNLINDPSWDWSFFDAAIDQVVAAGKKVFLRVLVQDNNTPEWVQANAQQFIPVAGGSISVYWDPYFQAAVIAMIQALGGRYGSNPNIAVFSCNIASTTSGDWSVPTSTKGNWTNSDDFSWPAYGGHVNVPTSASAGMSANQLGYLAGFGWFSASVSSGAAHTSIVNLGIAGNASSGTVPANSTMVVNDITNWTSPVYNYTTNKFVGALKNVAIAATNAFPNQIYTHEVGRSIGLDPR